MIARMNFRMLRFLKQVIWWAGIVLACPSAFGFALIGPVPGSGDPDKYQIPAIGYALGSGAFASSAGISVVGGFAPQPGLLTSAPSILGPQDDMGTPKSIGEGYRRNTPVLYYAFDATFMKFFGPDGAAEVDKAMAVFNNLTNVSSYSADLSEFPLESRRANLRAWTDSLLDIKSVTMGLITEQLGFWQPTRWVWALHGRAHIPGTGIPPCPGGMEYLIDKKNIDVVGSDASDYQYSSYVNGVLYSYFISEGCNTTPQADAIEFPVDPTASPYSAVADYTSFWYAGLEPGVFYTSLTRDDVGGLRYLIRKNDLAMEPAGARTIEFVTNSGPQAITTQDLSVFAAAAHTNDAAGLTALYPGLIITATSNYFGLSITTNINETLVNAPYDPAGFPPTHPLITTNYATNFVNLFQHTFANVITNSYSTRGLVASVSLGLTNSPYAIAGSAPTITTNVKPAFVNGVFGDFFLLPTNLCSVQILSNLLTQVIATTNLPTVVSNGVAGTTGTGATNAGPTLVFTPGSVSFFTNHVVVYLPVTCPVDPVGTYAGVEKIQFIRRDYDSIINNAWDPITNDYTILELTNSMLLPRHMQRAVPRPDFLFTAADLAVDFAIAYSNTVAGDTETLTLSTSVGSAFIGKYDVVRTTTYNQSARPGGDAGPGTIESPSVLPTLFIFNKIGPLYQNNNLGIPTNNTAFFMNTENQTPFLDVSWGSFDGTTNAPEVYPNGHTIAELEDLVTGPAVTTPSLPNATIGASYSAQLAATGGQPPYSWSLAPNSAGLPAGLNLSSDGQITGTPTGPAAIYDFTIRVTDSANPPAYRDVAFTITVF